MLEKVMERSLVARLGSVLVLLAPLALGAAGCMTHTRADDAGASPDAHVVGGCDGCSGGRDTPPDPCASRDARGEGACEAELGYVWLGGGCWPISGCSCVGADCASLAPTAEACLAEHASCDRFCGGLAEVDGCLPNEYCDYPDGSFCGGDDSGGLCRARPTECPDPGGILVCGCDGNEYIGECAANLVGVDVASEGPCVTTHAYDTVMAEADCGPADGPAWTITLTTDRTTCDETRSDGSLQISVWHALERAAPETTYTLRTDFTGDGSASICGVPGEPCAQAEGTIVFHVFAAGEVARFDFDLRTADGRRFAESNVEVARFWCRTTSPGCG
jgi:hypothetical protein